MNDLDEIEARLRHVFGEVSDLNLYIINGAGVETQISRDKDGECLSVRMTERANIAVRRKIADIITEYRSILNGIAAVLVARGVLEGKLEPSRAPDFPAYKEKYEHNSKNFFKAITAADTKKIPKCDNINDIIVQLAERDNKRKHRLLTVVTVTQIGMRYGGAVTIANASGSNVKIGREWTAVAHSQKIDRNAKPRVTLVFPETFGSQGAGVTEWIRYVQQYVSSVAANLKIS